MSLPLIRPMLRTDVQALVPLALDILPFAWSAAVFESCFAPEYRCWVLILDDQLIGFLVALVQHEECQLLNIGVARLFWRQGLARYLLQHLLRELQPTAVKEIWLEVRVSNYPAIAAYQQAGFTIVATRKDYYPAVSGREAAVVMKLSVMTRAVD